tara:strand:+ start:430 stop:831 length:402 start_codon:yes stop_codon:yes gene_type:complete
MKYKDMMGYPKKKKVIKEKVKKKKPTVVDNIKKELNEWNYKPPTEKRWSKSFGGNGLTDFENRKINEGPSYEYAKHIKKIDKLYDAYGAAVGDFEILLNKKGMKKEARDVKMMYGKLVFKFQKAFENFVRKLM